ncbi:uncharacterized protein LOC105697140 [Orussus abietinus]|uniref:uncharacterized protein LOC105697140 n=1 Tax=Orussus abietinus TaxID=222816 RepID=UPI0006265B6E|nr:uncharacterized protein LOC105697140 [Orussus abietinus]
MSRSKGSIYSIPNPAKSVPLVSEDMMETGIPVTESATGSTSYTSDVKASGHSTPRRNGDHLMSNNLGDSPKLESYSPIFLPLTQDAVDVAWGPDSPLTRARRHKANARMENTPKKSSSVRKKRIAKSNSPLLYPQTKRKLINVQNPEPIRTFAAEIKALTERIRLHRNSEETVSSKRDVQNIETELESQLVVEMDTQSKKDMDINVQVIDVTEESYVDKGLNKGHSNSFEDLFDDSIDDSMVRCSQEIEEKINIGLSSVGNPIIVHPTVDPKNKETAALMIRDLRVVIPTDSMMDSVEKSGTKSVMKGDTYKKSSTCLTKQLPTSKGTVAKQHSNGSTSRCSRSTANSKNSIFGKTNGLEFDFPDDSFDDCLAACEEAESLLCMESGTSTSSSNRSITPERYGKTYKNNHSALSKANISFKSSDFVPKKPSSSYKISNENLNLNKSINNSYLKTIDSSNNNLGAVNSRMNKSQETVPGEILKDRKFFKTKSLSDSLSHGQRSNNSSCERVTTSHSTHVTKSSSNTNLNQKNNSSVLQRAVSGSSVSTNCPTLRGCNTYNNTNLTSINSNSNEWLFNVNRCAEKAESVCGNRCNSSSEAKHDRKESSTSQVVQCTPEEIERKRLEAKMRLEAKRKMHSNMKTLNIESTSAVKMQVKR